MTGVIEKIEITMVRSLRPLTDEEVADVIAEAQAYIEAHGWATGTLKTTDGRVCARGGILFSQNWQDKRNSDEELDELNGRKLTQVEQTIGTVIPISKDIDTVFPLVHWNDNFAQNQQQVLDLFAKAEKVVRAGFDPDA